MATYTEAIEACKAGKNVFPMNIQPVGNFFIYQSAPSITSPREATWNFISQAAKKKFTEVGARQIEVAAQFNIVDLPNKKVKAYIPSREDMAANWVIMD